MAVMVRFPWVDVADKKSGAGPGVESFHGLQTRFRDGKALVF
jgi:hypothetical protein